MAPQKISAARQTTSPKQKEFINQYLILREGKSAAIAAGYSPKCAGSMASQLLQMPRIKRELNRRLNLMAKRFEAQLGDAMEQLHCCATRQVDDLVDQKTGETITDLRKLPKRAKAAMDSYKEKVTFDGDGNRTVEREFKFVPKASALDMSFKIRGDYAKTGDTKIVQQNNQTNINATVTVQDIVREAIASGDVLQILDATGL